MTHDEHVANALRILEILSTAPSHRIAVDAVQNALSCSPTELDGYLDLISTLADRRGGGRAIVVRDADELVLIGDAARMRPLRLTEDESEALFHVIDELGLDNDLKARLTRALVDPAGQNGPRASQLISSGRVFGPWYQTIVEAADDGVRIRMRYRAQAEDAPETRLVDPIAVETSGDFSYLLAWNVHKRSMRRYRLDRISSVELTDESVERHNPYDLSVDDDLSRNGIVAVVECSAGNSQLDEWPGIISKEPADGDGGRIRVGIRVSTMPWLFDEVLSSAGDIVIVEPAVLRTELVSYARGLLEQS